MQTKESIKKNSYEIEINDQLDLFFEDSIKQATLINSHYVALWKEMRRLINSGGKRIRPQMMILAYQVFGGKDVLSVMPIAAAQELLHLSMLIHDDIIDREKVRYGVSNITGAYEDLYSSVVKDGTDRLHYALSAALLAGDLLLSGSYQLITNASVHPAKIIEVEKVFSKSVFEVAGGELLDTESAFRPKNDISAATIAYYKTATYTFVSPLLIGALLADATVIDQTYLRIFAENLGIAYQLTDDIISVFGNEIKTGKSSSSDLREGKQTYMVEKFYDVATGEEKKIFETYFGNQQINENETAVLKDLLLSSKARDQTECAIDDYINKSLIAVSSLSINEREKSKLRNLVTTATQRDK